MSTNIQKARLLALFEFQRRQQAIRTFNYIVRMMSLAKKHNISIEHLKPSFREAKHAIESGDFAGSLDILKPMKVGLEKIITPQAVDSSTIERVSITPIGEDLEEGLKRERGKTVEPFSIQEVFLIYRDGRLITHTSLMDEDDVDKQVLSSMLVAIQQFAMDSFQTSDGLDSFEFSGKKVIMAGGKYLILVAVLEGKEPSMLREKMQSIIQKIEGLYAGLIEEWDGNVEHFEGVEKHLVPILRLKSKLKIREKKEDVRVKSAIEFYQGYVRLKVAMINNFRTTITDANFKLDWDTNCLTLTKVEPEYPMDGSTVIVGNIKPGEKKTIAYYLDPLICTVSYLEGTLIFYDSHGKKHTSDMKRRPADIVCPIFYTEETVNVAMLRRLVDELAYHDSKRYDIETVSELKIAYESANEAVRGHDIKFVRQFEEKKPFEGETWYYGEVKESEEKIVIRISARDEKKLLELYVASSNWGSITGLLAELGNELESKMKEKGISKDVFHPKIDDTESEEVEQTRLLLDKYADTELDVGETEQID